MNFSILVWPQQIDQELSFSQIERNVKVPADTKLKVNFFIFFIYLFKKKKKNYHMHCSKILNNKCTANRLIKKMSYTTNIILIGDHKREVEIKEA